MIAMYSQAANKCQAGQIHIVLTPMWQGNITASWCFVKYIWTGPRERRKEQMFLLVVIYLAQQIFL